MIGNDFKTDFNTCILIVHMSTFRIYYLNFRLPLQFRHMSIILIKRCYSHAFAIVIPQINGRHTIKKANLVATQVQQTEGCAGTHPLLVISSMTFKTRNTLCYELEVPSITFDVYHFLSKVDLNNNRPQKLLSLFYHYSLKVCSLNYKFK